MRNYFLLFAAVLLCFTGCTVGPKLKTKKAYMNGESYKANIAGVGVTRKRTSQISGAVFYKLEDSINFTQVYKAVLKNRANKEVDEFVLDRDGKFNFSGHFPLGDYLLEIKKGDRSVKFKRIKLNSYSLNNVEVFL